MPNKEAEPNLDLVGEMFRTILAFEVKNTKTQELDDKEMANAIAKYIEKKAKEGEQK